jgi:hypothetical protein
MTEPLRTVYVSSKLRHRDMWLASGIPTVSSWIFGDELPPEECSAMWDRYRDEVRDCEAIVLYVEPQDQLKGCMLELGMAFMSGHPMIVVWTGTVQALAAKMGTIVYHDSVRLVASIDEARPLLKR